MCTHAFCSMVLNLPQINSYLTITYTHCEKDVKWNMFGGNHKHKEYFSPLTRREDISISVKIILKSVLN